MVGNLFSMLNYSLLSSTVYMYIYSIVVFLDICLPLLESMLLSVFANRSRKLT